MAAYASPLVEVYLLDDHDLVRRGVRDLLVAARDIHVVGESSSTQGAAEAILRLGVSVMVLDVHLQDGTGVDVCRRVRAVDPSVSGLLLTSMDEDEALAATILAGASGSILKTSRGADIIGAVRRLGIHRPLIDAATTDRVRAQLAAQVPALELADDDRQILDDVVAGMTDSEIAARRAAELAPTSARVADLVGLLMGPR